MNKYTLRKIMNALFKAMLFLVLLTTIAGTCLFIYTSTSSGKKAARHILTSAVTAGIGARVEIGGISGNLLESMVIDDLRIFGPEGKQPVASAGRIRASYDLMALFFREVSIRRLEIDRMHVDLDVDKNKKLTLPDIAFPAQGDSGKQGRWPGLNVRISGFVIVDSELSIRDNSSKKLVIHKIADISGRAGIRVAKKVFVSVKALSFLPDRPYPKVSNLSGRIAFDPREKRIEISSVKIVTPGSRVSGDGSVEFGKKEPAFTLKADIAPLSCTEIGDIFKMSGDGEVSDPLFGTISGSGTQNRFSFDVSLKHRGALVTLAGQVRHAGNAWDLSGVSGRVAHLDPSVLPFFPIPDFPGDITAAVSFSGTDIIGHGRTIEIRADSSGLRLAGYRVHTGRIHCVLAGDDLDIREMTASMPWGRVRASAEIRSLFAQAKDKVVTLMAKAEGVDPGLILNDKRFSANLNFHVTASGRIPASLELSNSQFSGDIVLLDSRTFGIKHITGKLSARYKDQRLNVGSLDLASSVATVSGSGSADFQTRICSSAFSATVSDPKSFLKLVDAGNSANGLTGRASVSGTLSGTFDRPVVSATLDGADLVLGPSMVQAVRITGKWTGGPSFGSIACRTNVTGVSAGALRLSALFLETSATMDVIQVSGKAEAFDASLRVAANIKDWRSASKTLTITNLALDAKDYPSLTNNGPFKVMMDDETIETGPCELASGKAKLNLSGRMNLGPGGDILLNAVCSDFDLDRIAPFFEDVKGLSGRAEARIKIANTLEDPVADADIRIADPVIMGIGFSGIHLSVAGKTGEYKVMLDAQREGKKAATLSGTVFLPVCLYPFSVQTGAGRMDLSLRVSDFSISGLDLPFSDVALAQGDVSADVRITGDFKSPSAEGDIRFSNGSLVIKSLGLSYETCDAQLLFLKNRVRIIGLNIKGDKEGSLSASGSLSFVGRLPEAIDLSISGKNFYIPFQNAVFLKTEPDLTLTGSAMSPVLKGRIAVTTGTIDLLRLFSKKPAEIEVVNAPKNGGDVLELPEKTEQPGFMEPMAADIVVVVERNLWIKGKEENIEIKGRVNVKKSPDRQFVVTGEANAVRGTYMFRNRLFKITDGSLSFQGAEEIDPVLNITGRTRIPPVDIIAHLTGTFSALNLSLGSEPAMEQVDIVSYLMFGHAVNEGSSGESFRAQDAALSMTGQLAADQLKDILGKSFHLDVVQVNAGSGDLRQGSIAMGKYVANRVFVTYSQGFSKAVGRRVEVDYEINRHFSIEAQVGEETTSALDLIWRHDF